MSSWTNTFFTDLYADLYLDLTPTIHATCARGLTQFLPSRGPGLDLGCGRGHLCNALTHFGYKLTGIDIQPNYISTGLKLYPHLKLFTADFYEPLPISNLDFCINFYSSFGYGTDEQNIFCLYNIFNALAKKGTFILELYHTSSILALPASSFKEFSHPKLGTVLLHRTAIYNQESKYLTQKWAIRAKNTLQENQTHMRIYSISELQTILLNIGFTTVEVFDSTSISLQQIIPVSNTTTRILLKAIK